MSLLSIISLKKEILSPLNRILSRNTIAWLVLILVAILVFIREPRYFLQPRFWAEEGTLHFAFSYSHPWFVALFQPQVGYLNFWPNLATLLSTLVALENAPLITTLMALLVQLILVALILWSKSPLWDNWARKLPGVAIVLFVPLTTEVWLNSVTSYTFLAVVTFFILLVEPPAQIQRWFYRFLLVIGGLTGTLSCFLIPLFAYRAWAERDRERWLQLILLTVCAILQGILIINYKSTGSLGQRFHLLGLSTLGMTLWTQGFGLLAFGFIQAREWALLLYELAVKDLASFQLWSRLLWAVCFTLLFVLSANLPLKTRFLFVSAYFILMILPMMFSVIDDKYDLGITGLHHRIFLAPNSILGWMLLFGIQFRQRNGKYLTLSNLVSVLCLLRMTTSL
jgi:hypothetical protein